MQEEREGEREGRKGGKGEKGGEGGREEEAHASMVYSTTPLTNAHPEIQPATLWFYTTGCFL